MKMQKFSAYLEESVLNESLKSPVEFYMTDDTKMPKEIYAAFDLDGTTYGLSLIESEYDKVYMLDFYRIVSVKKRFWSFTKANHIRTCLSTVIKFMEACVPFVQNRMHGIIIDIPGKTGSEKYASFIERVLKRSYVKKYRSVPVVKTTDKARNYLFLVKVGVEPTSLFKTATFHKNFKFDAGKPVITSDEMDEGKGYYKTIKQTVSVKPSQKFAFNKLGVELVADEDTVSLLDKASKQYKMEKIAKVSIEPKKIHATIDLSATKEIFSQGGLHTPGKYYQPEENVFNLSYPHLMATIFSTAFDKVKMYGFAEDKFSISNLEYVSSQSFKNLPAAVQKSLIDDGIFTSSGKIDLTYSQKVENLKDAFKAFMLMDKYEVNTFESSMKNAFVDDPSSSAIKSTPKSYKLELDKKPVSFVPGFDTANLSSPYSGPNGFLEDNENALLKQESIFKMPEVDKWITKLDVYGEGAPLYEYSGASYGDCNDPLRQMISDKKLSASYVNSKATANSIKMLKYFKKNAPALDAGIWVYRNTNTPDVEKYEVGDDYIDAAFLSTSIRSSMSLASEGNTRLKIYLPKGTRCLPILTKSVHPQENEIVLPAASVLRIMEIYDEFAYNGAKAHRRMVCTMIGSAYESLLDGIENDLLLEQQRKNLIVDKKKKKEYDPQDKWSAPTSSFSESKMIKGLIEKGTLKLKQ